MLKYPHKRQERDSISVLFFFNYYLFILNRRRISCIFHLIWNSGWDAGLPPVHPSWNITEIAQQVDAASSPACVARSAWKYVYVLPPAIIEPAGKTCWIWRFAFFLFFPSPPTPPAAAAVRVKPREAVKRLLLFPLSMNGGAFHGNQGAVTHKAQRKVRAKESSSITSWVFFLFVCVFFSFLGSCGTAMRLLWFQAGRETGFCCACLPRVDG